MMLDENTELAFFDCFSKYYSLFNAKSSLGPIIILSDLTMASHNMCMYVYVT